MRTSLNEIKQAEDFLLGRMTKEEKQNFVLGLATNPLSAIHLHFQRKVMDVIRLYHRKKLKEEVKKIEAKIFTDRGSLAFQESIDQLFKSE